MKLSGNRYIHSDVATRETTVAAETRARRLSELPQKFALGGIGIGFLADAIAGYAGFSTTPSFTIGFGGVGYATGKTIQGVAERRSRD